jgi:hypothetical protein
MVKKINNQSIDQNKTDSWLENNFVEKFYIGIIYILALCALLIIIISMTNHIIDWQNLFYDGYLK